MPIPTLETERLILRPFALSDAPDVQRLANDPQVYATTLNIPHPYGLDHAERWIGLHRRWHDEEENTVFAIMLRQSSEFMGAINIRLQPLMDRAELGYWIGVPYWNRGYMSEAGKAVVRYGFEVLGLNRIYAMHFAGNPASGRVMQKIGMTLEGCLRQHVRKDDRYEDSVVYGLLREEWLATNSHNIV